MQMPPPEDLKSQKLTPALSFSRSKTCLKPLRNLTKIDSVINLVIQRHHRLTDRLWAYQEIWRTIGLSKHSGFFRLIAVMREQQTLVLPMRIGSGIKIPFSVRENRSSGGGSDRFRNSLSCNNR